jgi:elongation factor G
VPLQLPIGSQQDFKGILDLLHPPAEVPPGMAEGVNEARERLIEAIAETDDDLATKYLEGETLTDEELSWGLRKGVLSGKIVPVLAGSAFMNLGVKELLGALVEYMPSPKECPPVSGTNPSNGQTVELAPDPSGPQVAFVFKTSADPYVGKLSFFRVYSGTIRSDSQVFNAGKGQVERIGQLFVLRGKAQEQASELLAGDIGVVPKLSSVSTGDTLCQREQPVVLEGIRPPTPYYTMAVYPKSKADLDKMSIALSRIAEEDPSLRITREQDTGEVLISGLGDTHVEVTIEKIRRKFGTELVLQTPKVPYKETIAVPVARAEHRYKQQTGGHGHFAHVIMRLEPLPRGSGLQFAEEIVGGAVPKEFIPYVEKGVRRACGEGVVAGYPVVDLKVTLYDGSFHEVDSAGIDFDTAGYWGLKKGVQQGNPILLEPIMRLTIKVPDSFTGDVIGDLNGKRGRILGMTPQGGFTVIEAEAPLAEVQRYTIGLRSITQGRGSYTMEFSRYEEVPPHLAQRIIEEAKRAREEARA